MVGERGVLDVGGAVGAVGSETAVAKARDLGKKGRTSDIGLAYICRSLGTLDAILGR